MTNFPEITPHNNVIKRKIERNKKYLKLDSIKTTKVKSNEDNDIITKEYIYNILFSKNL